MKSESSNPEQRLKQMREDCREKKRQNDAQARLAPPPELPPALHSAGMAYDSDEFLKSPDARLVRVLSEYLEPLARFRRQRIQDTVVFFGSARFRGIDEACDQLELLANTTASQAAPPHEQPASADEMKSGDATGLKRKRAESAVEMAHYYEDARRLAFLLTQWSRTVPSHGQPGKHRFVVTSGGGPGIMEAANRGAYEAGGKTIGLNIKLPFEQEPNRYITPDLNFEFHYFFMRKFWFAYLAKALVVFPGGWGTMDEMFELLTLAQTHKLAKQMTVVVYGREYWESVINMQTFVDKGAISPGDLDLFQWANTPEEALAILQAGLAQHIGAHGKLDDVKFDEATGEAQRPSPEAPTPERPEDYFGPEIAETRS
jgi:uncharacterized protein (TIGR00730 family)